MRSTLTLFSLLFCVALSYYGFSQDAEQVRDFSTVAPDINQFATEHPHREDRKYDVGEHPTVGYTQQIILSIDAINEVVSENQHLGAATVRIMMGHSWDPLFLDAERRSYYWPADARYEALSGSAISVRRHKDRNECPPYCDYTHTRVGGDHQERPSSPPHYGDGLGDERKRIQEWRNLPDHDREVEAFSIHTTILREMNSYMAAHPDTRYIRVFHARDRHRNRILIMVPMKANGDADYNFVWKQPAHICPYQNCDPHGVGIDGRLGR